MSDEQKTVSYPYLRNLVGMDVDDESMKACPHAKAELYFHVSLKFEQLCSIVGGLVGVGYSAIKKAPMARTVMNGSRNGMLIGAPIGIVTLYSMMSNIEKKGETDMDYAFFDRSYRLRHNRNQVRVDRMSMIGSGVGVAAAAATGAGILGGAGLGLALGTVSGAVLNRGYKSS